MQASSNPVVIQDYDPAWPGTFSKLATMLRSTLGNLVSTVEHIGSTSVPGLAAKPIIDLDVVLNSPADLPEAIRLLASIDYVHEGDLGIASREAFHSAPGQSPHHLYVLSAGAAELRRHLAFRDALRADKILRDRYGALKMVLAKAHPNDRGAYTEAKAAFIASVIDLGDSALEPKQRNGAEPTPKTSADAVARWRTRLSTDLRSALKSRDQSAITALRCLLGALDNAGAQDPKAFGSLTEVPRKCLSESDVQLLIQAEINSRKAALIDYERGERHQEAAHLRAELVILRRYIAG
jgi:GrpB-like predicted nucleotidyltransferase (UPF0157 family)